MKNLFKKAMLFAAAAMAFVSCQNDATNDENVNVPGFEVSVNATTSEVVRSAFGDYNSTDKTYPTLWEGDEAWWIGVNNKTKENVNTITFSDDLTSANATFELNGAPTAAGDGTYTLYALSPAKAWSSYDLEKDYIRFHIARNTQTPTATSCDPDSQVLLAKSKAMDSADSFTVDFSHLSAYIKFSFVNVAEGGVVNSVTIAAEDVNLAGRYEYTLSTGELAEKDQMSKDITLVTESHENLWVSVAPVDLSGKELTFSITTDKGVLLKEVTMPATAKLESGKVVTFNVDMAGIDYPSAEEGEEWYLVTNTADLTDGEYIIVGQSKAGNVVYLPSTTNTSAAPSQKVINVPGLDLTSTDAFKTTLIPEDARFAFTGSASKMTIKNAEGKYLYAFDNNNGLRVGDTSDTWSFGVHSKNSKSLTLKGATKSRYITLYQSQDWRSYTSIKEQFTSTTGADQNGVTFIYKKVSTDPFISSDAISVEAAGGEGESSYTRINMGEIDDVEVVSKSEWISVVAGGGRIRYEVAPNYTGKVMNGEIVLGSTTFGITKTIPVTQAADVFTVSATSVSLKSEANSTATFTVTSTYAATIEVDDSSKWSVSPATVAAGSTTEITVTAKTANTTAEAVPGTITVTRSGDNTKISVTASQDGVQQGGGNEGGATEVVDVLNQAWTEVSGTTYSAWSNKTSNSTAVYAGNSAGGNSSIQLRTNNSNSGIITTTSGGKVAKIVVKWHSGNSSGRKLDIYGKNTAYSAATDLYGTSDKQGTKLGTIAYGISTELTISGDYAYIGIRSNSGALYLEEVKITWVSGNGGNTGGDDSGNTGGGDDSGNTGGESAQPVTETLSFANSTYRTSWSTTEQVWEQNGITFTHQKGTGNNLVNNVGPIRCYANSNFTITATGNITKIVYDANSTTYANDLKSSIGTVAGATVSVSSDKVTITYSTAVESASVKLSKQVRLDAITVTYLQ